MRDDLECRSGSKPRIDARVLRYMMHETIDLLDASSEHADEACTNTDAAMALTRIDWMLMGVFNWLTDQLRSDRTRGDASLGEPVSVIGIDQSALSAALANYAQTVDRLHARVKQLESLVAATVETRMEAAAPRHSGQVLHIFGDPAPAAAGRCAVLESRQRLKSALAGN